MYSLYVHSKKPSLSLARNACTALLTAAAMLMIASVSSVSHAQASTTTDTPIRFAKGQISSTLSGKLKPSQNEHWYQFNASSGQYAVINIAPRADIAEVANVGVLHLPNGTQDGSKGGIIYQGCLPTSGKYRLRIARNLMATQGGTAGFMAEVILLPKYASQELCP